MNITIASTENEIKKAKKIRQLIFVNEQNVPLEIELDEFDNEAIHFISYLNNEPVGASRLRIINDFGKLERICLLKQYRGKGFGKKMVQAMESELINKNVKTSKLNAQVQAQNFYKGLGYHVVSEPFNDANILHVTMEKQLF